MGIHQAMSFKEGMKFGKLKKDQQKELKEMYKENPREALDKFYEYVGESNPEVAEKMKTKRESGKTGVINPSEVTKRAFEDHRIDNSLNKLTSVMGMFTMNMAQQAQMLSNELQRKTDFIQIAQRDELIKQNQTLIEQNETMIELMKQMANK
ncbi:hypothetical protein [Staphylococcus saprophyticus]|uniref:hypothetical protein n=1 Tax=Staphylococcus saprophyticus TaxID=29385 RepID=UPI0008531415|nr:hypothetical protein [Staphylococcus saprophyticus]OEK41283.1 hypothetical protein ASS88_01335 [Staphylococcus saprophyticus]